MHKKYAPLFISPLGSNKKGEILHSWKTLIQNDNRHGRFVRIRFSKKLGTKNE